MTFYDNIRPWLIERALFYYGQKASDVVAWHVLKGGEDKRDSFNGECGRRHEDCNCQQSGSNGDSRMGDIVPAANFNGITPDSFTWK